MGGIRVTKLKLLASENRRQLVHRAAVVAVALGMVVLALVALGLPLRIADTPGAASDAEVSRLRSYAALRTDFAPVILVVQEITPGLSDSTVEGVVDLFGPYGWRVGTFEVTPLGRETYTLQRFRLLAAWASFVLPELLLGATLVWLLYHSGETVWNEGE